MTKSLLAPLRGLRPPPDRAAEVAELPYDVMDRAEAIAMARGRPYSFLRVSRPDIDLPGDQADDGPRGHAQARRAWDRLRAAGLMVPDPEPALHAYRMSVAGHMQTGVVGGADVAAYDEGRIRRHEVTRPAKQADRAGHIEALGAQTGPVFLIHRPSRTVAEVLAEVTETPAQTDLVGPGGVRHQLWPITDQQRIATLVRAIDELGSLYIADGHHRSAAASMVHARRGTPGSGMFLSVAFSADQVQVLPYNRVVRTGRNPQGLISAIAGRFDVASSAGPVAPEQPGTFGLYLAGRWYRLAARDHLRDSPDPAQRLDVSVLQRHILDPMLGIADPRTDPRIGFVGGIRPLAELQSSVDAGAWDAAFSMHATTVADLLAVADAGGIMPPKSTWFEPKLLDGLVCHSLD